MRDIIGMLAFYMAFIDDEDDREKFEIIYNVYRKRMVSTAYSLLRNHEDAEDAVHDTFIKIARNMNSIGDQLYTQKNYYIN